MSKTIKKKLYHKFINNKLVYDNKAVSRYKKINKDSITNEKLVGLKKLREKINSIKNCDLKKNATNLVFSDGNPNSKVIGIVNANSSVTGVFCHNELPRSP